ncbi:MAG: hypothetical protein CMC04_00755 [Flavobacteriaceae bacterium]|nr:hypothetical protein [Flavobacteriaceae bacterium]
MVKKLDNMKTGIIKDLDFSKMTVIELKAVAKKNDISGISKLKKVDIIKFLKKSLKNNLKKEILPSIKEEKIKKPTKKNEPYKKDLINLLQIKINDQNWNKNKNEIEKIIDQLETIFHNKLIEEKNKFISKGGEEIDFRFKSLEKENFENLLYAYRKTKRLYFKEIEKQKKNNSELKKEIIEQIKALIGSDNPVNTIYKKFKLLQENWHKTGPALRSENNNLWETYKHHVERFYDFLHINRKLRDIDYKHNYDEKIKIIEQAEALVKVSDILKAGRDLNTLHRLWKNDLGPVAPENREILWKRFQDASKIIHSKRQDFQKNIEKNHKINLDRKNAILSKIKKLVDPLPKNHKEWQSSIKKFNELRNEFKSVGPISKKESKNNWSNFRESGRDFNLRKNKFYKNQKHNQKEIVEQYENLIKEVKEINKKEDWKNFINRMKTIQVDFNNLGFIPRNLSKKFRSEFRIETNQYFKRLKSGYEKINAEEKIIFNNKVDMVNELKKIKYSEKNIIDLYNEQWDKIIKIGTLSKSLESKISELFLKVAYGLMKADNTLKENKSKILFEIELHCLKNKPEKLQEKINFYMKDIDSLQNEINQLENNFDFFSQSSANSPLLKDVSEKLNRLTSKLFVFKERVNKIKTSKKNTDLTDKNNQEVS